MGSSTCAVIYFTSFVVFGILFLLGSLLGIMINSGMWWNKINPWWGYTENGNASMILTMVLVSWILSLVVTILLILRMFFIKKIKRSPYCIIKRMLLIMLVVSSVALVSVGGIVSYWTVPKGKCERIHSEILKDAKDMAGSWDYNKAEKYKDQLSSNDYFHSHCVRSSEINLGLICVFAVSAIINLTFTPCLESFISP